MTPGIIVFAHGSRIEPANEAVRLLAAQLAEAGGFSHVIAAFLELGQPDLENAAATLARQGTTHIVVVPYFLTLGLHMERDLPRLIEDILLKNKGIRITVAPPLDGHSALVNILLDRARNALGAAAPTPEPPTLK